VVIAGRRSRPRRLEWEDDGVSVPWLSSGLAVYLIAILNTPFWRRAAVLVAPATLEGALFHGALFAALTALYACVLCLITVRGLGRPLLAAVVLYSSCGLYLLDNFGPALPDMLHSGAGWREFVRGSALWQIGLLGMLPALLIAWAPIGRRRGVREVARRLRFCLLCLLLAACATGAAYPRLIGFFAHYPEMLIQLNPVNVIKFGTVREAADVERLFVPRGDSPP